MTNKPTQIEPRAWEEESPSEVLRATHLMVIALEEVRTGDWMPEESGLKKRFVELGVRLEHVWKGETSEKPGDAIILRVQQRGTGTFRVSDDYGVWSKLDLGAGLRLLAFCSSASKSLAELLQPPQCEQLAGAKALPEVRAALDLEARKLTAVQMLAAAPPLLERGRGILARYIWARVRQAVLADEALFEAFTRILERPGTSAEARDVLLTAAHEELGLAAAPPREALLRLARAMLVLLAVPEAQPLHGTLAQVYLPNLIGLSRGRPQFAAASVFATSADGWAAARTALASHPDWDPAGQLSQWLAAPPRHR